MNPADNLIDTVKESPIARLKVTVRGAVQGVGFRPFVHRLATELGLAGWVNNGCNGVSIEVEGRRADVEIFLLRLPTEKPPRSFIQSLESSWLDAVNYKSFDIRPSDNSGARTTLILPDIATCADCLRDIFDPANRRHLYPFTNCTNCGPRFSIIEALPYDRCNTTMKQFALCPQCREEYENPTDRRFHAQPNACPVCGPHLELWDPAGKILRARHDALLTAAQTLRDGAILAVKGLGGFHLMTDARNDAAVRRLRELKHREEKPFALMFPSLEAAAAACEISPLEERLLRAPESPIVLLRRKPSGSLSSALAPRNPYLGVMLPYTPLHHILARELGFPMVATSGNMSDEPICIHEHEAVERLGKIADALLVHNRPIARAVDDSVTRIMAGREIILRRARGYAPLPVTVPACENAPTVLAVGAHLKNTVALAVGPQIFISPHIGDLETESAFSAFRHVAADLQNLFDARPAIVARDAHPDYLSTQFAAGLAVKNTISVQHHAAHVLACMAENELKPPALGVSWDGTGLGTDGTIWGGEFLLVTEQSIERCAHLRTFPLAGGDKAVKDPRRSALGLLHELSIENLSLGFTTAEICTLRGMLREGVNSPPTSSMGRLFDAVAALLGLCEKARFEGQAAMELEFALDGVETDEAYQFAIGDSLVLDWQPVIEGILSDKKAARPIPEISAKFHNALVSAIIEVAGRTSQTQVALSGGCFQNRYLTERAVKHLEREGFCPYWHQRVPPNDGGIALGQVMAARRSFALPC